MSRRQCISPAIVIALLASLGLTPSASAANCKAGFVPRAAAGADTVCVTPASKARVAAENARAPLLWLSGPFGLKTCAQGFVWREAFIGDLICVTPLIRTAVRLKNDTAADRQQ